MTSTLNRKKIIAMRAGGQKLARIKNQLVNFAHTTSSLKSIEKKAVQLIKQAGGQPSFQMVPNYHWATCINLNAGVVHGIPRGKTKPGDLVTIDIGLYYQGYHTDTAITFVVGQPTAQQKKFLQIGQAALKKAINQARPGKKVKHISLAIQTNIEKHNYNVVRNLTGHGIGQKLHQPPAIPCFMADSPNQNIKLIPNMGLAIEVMYMQGDWPLKLDSDKWTFRTQDGSLSAMFEETVLVTADKPEILTAAPNSYNINSL